MSVNFVDLQITVCVFSRVSSQLPTITMRTRCRAVVRNHPKHPSTTRRCRSIEANAESTLRQPWPLKDIQREKGQSWRKKRWKLLKRPKKQATSIIMSLELWHLTQRDGSQIKEDQSSKGKSTNVYVQWNNWSWKLKLLTSNHFIHHCYLMCPILPWTDEGHEG